MSRKVVCPECGTEVAKIVPPFRTGHRPIPKLIRHNVPESEGGGRCPGSFTGAPTE